MDSLWSTDLAQIDLAQTDLAQAEIRITITDLQINPTPDGLDIVLISDQPLPLGTTQVAGNAFIADIPNAVLNLIDQVVAEQFGPADGIAVVQLASLSNNQVQLSITGTEEPPEVQVSSENNNLVLSVVPSMPTTAITDEAEDTEAIQIVVTANRVEEDVLDIPRSVTVITREQLDQQRQLTNNLPDILGKLVPGLGPPTLQSSTRTLSLRGRPALILIDGIPQNPNSGFQTELNVIDPASVERIEVLRGPSASYGDGATGGIINIITRTATNEPVVYDLSTGTNIGLTALNEDNVGYSFQVGVSGSGENIDGRLSVSYDIRNAQFDANGDRIPPETRISDTDRLGLLAKFGYDLTTAQRLELTYSFYRERLETDFTSDPIVFEIPGLQSARALKIQGLDYEREPQQSNQSINLTYRHDDLFGSQLDAQLYYRDTELVQLFTDLRSLALPAFFPVLWQTSLESSELGLRLQVETPIGRSASVLWGADYAQEDSEAPLLVSDAAAFDANRELNIVEQLSLRPQYDLDSLGLFTQAKWDITQQWQVSGGIRYDNFDFSVDDYELAFSFPREREGGSGNAEDVSFNAGLLYQPTDEIGIFASFAQGFSIPDLGSSFAGVAQDFDIDSDLLLKPQSVDNYEIGIRFNFDQVQASLAGFYSESDLGSALQVGADGLTELVRAPQRNYGVEATLDWQPANTWQLGGYFSWNEGENDVDDDGDFDALSSVDVPPYKLGLYVENDTTPRWTNRLQLLAVGDRDRAFDDGVDGFDIDGYITLDFLSSVQIGAGQFTLGIENLLNNQYLPVSSQERIANTEERRYAAPGAVLSLGYSVNF